MNVNSSDFDETALRIAKLEQAFEQQWITNLRPNIESYLGYVEKNERSELLKKLVAIDVKQRVRAGEEVSDSKYRQFGLEIAKLASAVLDSSKRLNDNEFHRERLNFKKKTIGRYRLLQKIGEGGMGMVYMADQIKPIRRRVAVKLIRVGSDEDARKFIARFEAERQALAVMNHENICKILDAGNEDGTPYFVMELVNGIPITKYCDRQRLTIRERLDLFLNVCSAVQHAHQKGIIHRDLKPSNILVAPHDGRPVPKVIDFGLAKTLEAEHRLTDKTMFTEFGMVLGTAMYMSPEQAELNQLDVDTRSDIYSLGVILYELLTGSPPRKDLEVGREMTFDVLKKISEAEAKRPSTRRSADVTVASNRGFVNSSKLQQVIRGELDWIVMKCIEKDRFRRYETVNAFGDDIDRYLQGEPVLAGPPSKIYLLKKFAFKHWKALSAGSALSLTVVGLIVFLSYWIQKESFNKAQNELKAAGAEYRNAISYWETGRLGQYVDSMMRIPEKYRFIEWRLAMQGTNAAKIRDASVDSIAISPNGKYMATGGSGFKRQLMIWDLAKKKVIIEIDSPHGDETVNALKFHPTKNLLLTAGSDDLVRFWNSETWNPAANVPIKFKSRVYALDISKDGSKIVAAGGSDINDRNQDDQFLTVIDLDDPARVVDLIGHQRRVTNVQFGLSDSRIISCSCDRDVCLWDANTGTLERKWQVSSLAWDCCLTADGSKVFVAVEDNSIFVFDVNHSGRRIWRGDGHVKGSAIFAIAISPDGSKFATGGFDGMVKLWHGSEKKFGDQIQTFRGHQGFVNELLFTPDNKQLISAGADGTTRFWDLDCGPEALTLSEHQESVNAVDFSPDSQLLISGSGFDQRKHQPFSKSENDVDDNSIRIWDLSNGEIVQVHRLAMGPITDVEFDPRFENGEVFAAAGRDGKIKLVDRMTGKVRLEKMAHQGGVNGIRFNSSGNRLASVGNDGTLSIWNTGNGSLEYQHVFEPEGEILCLDWSDDESRIVVGSRSGTVFRIDVQNRELLQSIPIANGNAIYDLAIGPNGSKIFVGGTDLHVLENSGKTLRTYSTHFFRIYTLDVYRDGPVTRLLSGSHNGSWKLWDADNMDVLRSTIPYSNRKWNHILEVKVSPDGQKIAVANSDHRIQIWNCSREE